VVAYLADGPRAWIDILAEGKLAGHGPSALERVRARVAETFKRRGLIEEEWLWRRMGDTRTDPPIGLGSMG
jgi:hypothetical protein